MPERGGPATQSGILYQNSVAALYMGRLCDETPRPEHERVVRIRVEAPEHVDDTVVHYADGHVVFIQTKESVRVGDDAWKALWHDFVAQYHADTFVHGRDRLRFHVGELREEHYALRELCRRASTSENATKWLDSLTVPHRRTAEAISGLLGPRLPGGEEALRAFFAHVDVVLWPSEHLQQDWAPQYIPVTSVTQQTLFRLLRDRVGGTARYRDSFESRPLRDQLRTENQVEFRTPPDIEVLRSAVRDCSALLRQHKRTLGGTGIHLHRAVSQEIADWACDASHGDGTAMLLDSAGTGKTVVMQETMGALEERGATVLAIKADQQLSGVNGPNDLQRKLALPEPVERVVGRLGAIGPTVMIIDQVDALSLSLARDQRALDEVLALVARLRELPGVTVLLSCRTFDRNADPRLKRMDVGRVFALPLLQEAEVAEVLEKLGIDKDALTPATLELLRTPLHLDLFARVAQAGAMELARIRGIRSLQELYGLLWQEAVLQPIPGGPSASDKERALRVIVDRMNRDQRTSVPRSMFAAAQTTELAPAADWLASAGILVAGAEEWNLLHQTFFDYCFARFFVEDGRALTTHVLESDQGLFVRPQIVQVLSFLRGTRNPDYLRELAELLRSDRLRVHLRELLLRWFGAVSDPRDDEWILARRLLLDPATRPRLLGALWGNREWFMRVRTGPLREWLTGDPDRIDQEVIPYLGSLVDAAQAEVAEVVASWWEQDAPWPNRLRYLFWRVRKWHAPAMLELYERYLRSRPFPEVGEYEAVDDVAKTDPAAGARLVRILLDAALGVFLSRAEPDSINFYRGIRDEFSALEGNSIEKAIETASKHDPRAFLDAMIPWLERVVGFAEEQSSARSESFYTGDPLTWGWYSAHDQLHKALAHGYVRALVEFARQDQPGFLAASKRMAALSSETPQRMLATAYRELAPAYVNEACGFLLGDPRRLTVGEDKASDTRRLIEAISPLLPQPQLQDLEDFILTHSGKIERLYGNIHDLKRRGIDQLFLLQAFARHRLSEPGRRRLDELERKFPGVVAIDHPRGGMAVWVGSPIGGAAAEKMSNTAWLGAMAKYAHGVSHENYRLGGARELARVLKVRAQAEPERFYALAQQTPSDLDDTYAEALIDGLAESTIDREKVFELVRRFAPSAGSELRRWIAWVLEKIVNQGTPLPTDLLNQLSGWVRRPPCDDEAHWEQQQADNISMAAMNTERGAALGTLMNALARESGNGPLEARWEWMEYAAEDPSVVFRIGALSDLVYLLDKDQGRAIELFERLVKGMPRLRETHSFQEFLYWGAFGHFARLAGYVEEVMCSEKQESRQRGAELAVLARISTRGLESDAAIEAAERLAERAITGPAEWRRGAARVYAHNLIDGPTELCVEGLRKLLDDPDEDVRQEVDWFVHRLREGHVFSLRDFLAEFAASRAFQESPHSFDEYLWENGEIDPSWALEMVEVILDNAHPVGRHGGWRGGEELVRLVLRIYTDPTADAARRKRAMDTFDRLMNQFATYAWSALEEWDRN